MLSSPTVGCWLGGHLAVHWVGVVVVVLGGSRVKGLGGCWRELGGVTGGLWRLIFLYLAPLILVFWVFFFTEVKKLLNI